MTRLLNAFPPWPARHRFTFQRGSCFEPCIFLGDEAHLQLPAEPRASCPALHVLYDSSSTFPIGPQELQFIQLTVLGGTLIVALYTINGFMVRYHGVWLRSCGGNNLMPRRNCPITVAYNTVLLLNCAVFAAWRVEEWQPVLVKHFVLSRDTMQVHNLVLCAFSHIQFGHLFSNMFSMHGSLEIWRMPEHGRCTHVSSCHGGELVCFYLSAAVASSLCGLLAKIILDIPIGSIGASGAICGLVAYKFTAVPTIISPQTGFNSKHLLLVLMSLDMIGVIQMFLNHWFELGVELSVDYCVHMGGYVFGIVYASGFDGWLLRTGRSLAGGLINALNQAPWSLN